MDGMARTGAEKRKRVRWRIRVGGTVQGVGFRPFVYRLAYSFGLEGWVRNTSEGALIEAQGDETALESFIRALRENAPPAASVRDTEIEVLEHEELEGFRILESPAGDEVRTTVPPDIATCAECLDDIGDPENRRFGYPFTNCTNCGPRFTIINKIPYDRISTTMSFFEMCPDCRREYEDPADRRFHAQPNACPVCGPRLSLDVSEAARILREGGILAVKGLGGYHLACDARNDEAVRTLRRRKGRSDKPFALMCADPEEARLICEIDAVSEGLLLSPESPIVLMPARKNSGISASVAPGTGTLGVMLPYTPLHHLLMRDGPRLLVMTSGNVSEEPIVFKDGEVEERLNGIPDHVLSHDRPIHIACDDSVMRVVGGVPGVVRRARGFVPRPIYMEMEMPEILACGGDLKSAFCVTKGYSAYVSQHLGDLENARTLDHYGKVVGDFCKFFEIEPKIVAYDMHPDYFSTQFARSFEAERKIAVQHHHAHISSCMAENGIFEPVIGVAFDGTGYGDDGTIWGGEFLIVDMTCYKRAAHLSPVPLPGGDAAVRRPGRMALSYLRSAGLDCAVPGVTPEEADTVVLQMERGLNAPLTSSAGRLFDAVSALLGICTEVTYEGQAAIELEAAGTYTDRSYGFRIAGSPPEIDVSGMIAQIVEDRARGVSMGEIAGAFHNTAAEIIAETCRVLREETGISEAALSGGVFQNALLTERAVSLLEESGFKVYRHRLVPCNDGGISLGQAVSAAVRCK